MKDASAPGFDGSARVWNTERPMNCSMPSQTASEREFLQCDTMDAVWMNFAR